MADNLQASDHLITARSLLIGAFGAFVGWGLSVPVYVLIGPALAVALASLMGLRCDVAGPARYVAFIVIGIGVGSGVDPRATDAMIRWPVAFVVLVVVLGVIMWAGPLLLRRGFGFRGGGAVLAASPGHLSFVMAMSVALETDVTRVVVTQAVRILSLTVLVPFVALFMGVEIAGTGLRQGAAMQGWHVLALAAVSVPVALLFARLNIPVPVLIAAMIVSALAHVRDTVPGVLPGWLGIAGFVVIGTMIGSRFSGVTLAQLRRAAGAGLAMTGLSVLVSVAAAIPVAAYLDMEVSHVLIAFAPGGLETMLAMGVVLGADPGFVAAAHVVRLLVLAMMLPLCLRRRGYSRPGA